MSEALITQLERLANNTAWEAPLPVVLQDVDALLLRLRNLTGEEARACQRAILEACAELAALTGRLASHHYSPCTRQESAAGLQLTITDLGERCWRAVAACKVAWDLFDALNTNSHVINASQETYYPLLANCSATFGPACSLMHQLCCAAGQLAHPAQQRVAVSLTAAAEVVLTALGEALRPSDFSPAPPSAALGPLALVRLLGDAMDIIQFVGTATGPAIHRWSAGVWRCLGLLLSSTGRKSLQQQHLQQLRSLATATHSSLFAEFSDKGFSSGWGRRYWQVPGVLWLCSFDSGKKLHEVVQVPQDDSTICERCGVLLGLLPMVGRSQEVLALAIHSAAGLSCACAITLSSAAEAGAQPLSVAQLLSCLDAVSLSAAAAMAGVELRNSFTDASRLPDSLPYSLRALEDHYSSLFHWTHFWEAAGVGGNEAMQLAASAAEAAECAIRLAGLLLRRGAGIEGCRSTTLSHLLSFALQLLAFAAKTGGSGAAFLRASCSASVSAAKLSLTMAKLPQARQAQWSSDGSTHHNHAASLLMGAAAECCTAAASAVEELQENWKRQHDAAVLSLLYAGQQLALSSSICKEDVQCLIGLLKLGSQLAEAASSPLLFHNLGGEGMLTTGCTRLLDHDFAEFVSAQPALDAVACAIHEGARVELFLGAGLVACGFVEKLVCRVEKGLQRIGNTSKKMRTVLAELRNVELACCASVAQEAHAASDQPTPASCEGSPSCRWQRQHAAWFEDAAEKQLCRAKTWARFRQETLPQLVSSAAAVAKARTEAGMAGREQALQRAAAALQARACAHLGSINLRGCCEGRLPARRQGEAGQFCSPECQAAAEGQLARLCK